jgi:type 1 fimbriae regulatory protein FimB/type 1 fimbriae regulatory protein FimE
LPDRPISRPERRAIKIQDHADLRFDLALIVLGDCPYSCDSSDSAEPEGVNYMANAHLSLASPTQENRTVTPRRRPNSELRPREHLTEREVEMLMEAARADRWGQRNSTMILMAFRHGLRASELCELQWSDVEFESGTQRAGIESQMPFPVHPHMLRHACGFVLANKGTDTRTLQAYLGHRSIQSTVRYTELAPGRFKNLWR